MSKLSAASGSLALGLQTALLAFLTRTAEAGVVASGLRRLVSFQCNQTHLVQALDAGANDVVGGLTPEFSNIFVQISHANLVGGDCKRVE